MYITAKYDTNIKTNERMDVADLMNKVEQYYVVTGGQL